jgi:OOP family OmpA-OmpF porin
MSHKTRLLAGVALGCVLSAPAAFAEEYRGFYFSAWGGSGEMDFYSKRQYDAIVTANLPAEFADIANGNLTSTSTGTSYLDDSLSVWGAQLGFRFNKYVAVEFGYVDLGELFYSLPGELSGPYSEFVCSNNACDTVTRIDYTLNGSYERATQVTSTGITGSVLGMFPIGPRFDVHARGGLYYADTRASEHIRYVDNPSLVEANVAHRRVDASATELFAGIGGAWNINESFTLRVEYQKYFDVGDDRKAGESDIDVLNLAVLFK